MALHLLKKTGEMYLKHGTAIKNKHYRPFLEEKKKEEVRSKEF